MYELSLFVLDLVQNSLTAEAGCIKIWLFESQKENNITIVVADNGRGMSTEELKRAVDPFMTTKANRKKKIGLGLPFFKQLVESCEGTFKIKSRPGTGTIVTGQYPFDNVDQPPTGEIEETICSLVIANPAADFRYIRKTDNGSLIFDTRPVRKMLGPEAELMWQSTEIMEWFRKELSWKN